MGYQQKDVARSLGLKCANRISQWENGITTPSLSNALKLSRLYGKLLNDIYSEYSDELFKELPANIK